MASKQNKTQERQKKGNIKVQQQEIKLENMELNSKEVEPPINFYLSSLEEQVRCDLKDSKARITPTKSEGRILLEIDEDSLQHFLDHLQEKNEGDMQKEICGLKAQLHEAKKGQSSSRDIEFVKSQLKKSNTKLQNAQRDLEQQTSIINEQQVKLEQLMGEKEALQNEVEAKKKELRAEMQIMAGAKTNAEQEQKYAHLQWQQEKSYLTAQLVEAQAETRKTSEALKEANNLLETGCLHPQQTPTTQETLLDEQKDNISKLKTALEKAKRKLKNETLRWDEEKSSFKAQQEKSWDNYNAQLKIIASLRTEEKKAKQTLLILKLAHKSQLKEQQAETTKTLVALKNTEDLLETERLRCQTLSSLTAQLETSRSNCLAKLEMQENDKNLMAALKKKFEDQLESEHFLWQREKASLQKDALRKKSSFKVQLVHQQKKNNSLLAAVMQAEQLLRSRSIEWQQEKSSLDQAHLKVVASLQTQEEEATQMLERTKASHKVQLEDQTAEINRIAADLKNTADLLELERLCCQELSSLTTTLEASQSNCLAKLEMQESDNKNLIASLKNRFEDQLESERLLWQQEKDSFRVQLGHHQEENNNLLAAVTQAEQLLKRGSIKWQEEKSSLHQATENIQQTLHEQQQEWQTTENSLKAQLKDLQSQVTSKQKKKKWYKLF